MDYNLLENVHYCYQFFQDSKGLLLYTHIPPVIIALTFAAFVLWHARTLAAWCLAAVATVFTIYSTIDLFQWILVDSSSFIVASWAVLGILTALMFLGTHAFVHAFVTRNWMPRWMSTLWLGALAPIIALTPTTFNIIGYDLRDCIAVENIWFTNYYYALGLLAITLMYCSIRTISPSVSRVAGHLVALGAILFIVTFMATGVLATYLVDAGYIPDFGMTQYGIAAMSIFIGLLGYVTAYYEGFSIKILSAQFLVVGLLALVASQSLFVSTSVAQLLVLLTLAVVGLFGVMLVRSVQKEVIQRQQIEMQGRELERINREQESLLHFISHEVKGFLAEGQNAFAAIVEGDFGEAPPRVKDLSAQALQKMRIGVSTVMDILDAANLKRGSMNFAFAPFDMRQVVERVIETLQPHAAERHITITLCAAAGEQVISGDAAKIERHVVRNLIDNAIRYTPSGTITVSLERTNTALCLSVADTGVGITSEDMQYLFTEGGHGKESIKINVDSTGFGLFVAKQVVLAHGGKVWAESEGKGRGSRFIVEFPVTANPV